MILSPALFTSAAAWPSALAVLAYVVACLWPQPARPSSDDVSPEQGRDRAVWALMALGWLAQATAIVLDAVALDEAVARARFGFASALSATTWLVVAVYAIESRRIGLPAVRRVLAALAAVTVLLAWLFPGQTHMSSSPWAPIHWLLGFASYGLFGAALLHAALLRHAEKQMRSRAPTGSGSASSHPPVLPGQAMGMPLLRLESLTLRFVGAGFIMLSLTLLLGFFFAKPWHWDHKSVFSVLSWLVFATLLIGRARFG